MMIGRETKELKMLRNRRGKLSPFKKQNQKVSKDNID